MRIQSIFNNLKRTLCLLLIVCLCSTLLPTGIFAADKTPDDVSVFSNKESRNIPEGNCSNRYLSDLKIYLSNDEAAKSSQSLYAGNSIYNFNFDTNITDYNIGHIILTQDSIHLKPIVNPDKQNVDSDRDNSIFVTLLKDGIVVEKAANIRIEDADFNLYQLLAGNYAYNATLSVVVGEKYEGSVLSTHDVYNFQYEQKPILVGLQMWLGEKATTSKGQKTDFISPASKYNPFDATFHNNTYCAYIPPNQEKICVSNLALNSIIEEKLTRYYRLGSNTEWTLLSKNKLENINVNDCKITDSEIGQIQIKIAENSIENIYTILLFSENKVPKIKTQPASQSCDKGQSVTLSIETEGENTNLKYQWMKTDGWDFSVIPDANGSSYIVPASNIAGTTRYKCVVTDASEKFPLSTTSDIAEITVNLNCVNNFNVLKEFGTFTRLQSGIVESYKTDYQQGEKFQNMPILLPKPEHGAGYTFKIFHNIVDDRETAEPYKIDVANVATIGGNEVYALKPSAGLDAGYHYIFWEVYAYSKENPSLTSDSVTGCVKLVYSASSFSLPSGTGTSSDPFKIQTVADLEQIRKAVNEDNNWLSGLCFEFGNDLTLPANWTPIGLYSSETNDTGVRAFGGHIDGKGHTLTIPEGGKPLLKLVSDTVIKNLNISGKKIDGCGLIDGYFVDYGPDGEYATGCPETALLENIRLLSGSSTRRSGIIEGSGSGANTIRIQNCVVESGVTIGYTGEESGIGSFGGGHFNGELENCYSNASVKGKDCVGGLVGGKGESMGLCQFINCGFAGTINASGNWIGGIIASGYDTESAPNTPPVSFNNCYVKADISGGDYIGGIFGGEGGLKDALNECILSNSSFYGSINSNGTHVGGIIGHYEGINTLQKMENNYFCEINGKTLEVIGTKNYVIGEGNSPFSDQDAADQWYAAAGSSKTQEEFSDGSVAALLNNSTTSFKNWVQGKDGYPVHDTKAIITRLEVSGTLTTQHYIGDSLKLDGLSFIAVWSDGRKEEVPANEIEVTGYDANRHGLQTLTAAYGAVNSKFDVTVYRPAGTITVQFELLGDNIHEVSTSNTHTLADRNLSRWIPSSGPDEFVSYTVDTNATVKDVVEKALSENEMTCSNPSGNYIESITWGDVTLAEFSNGQKSGWMYTLNGKHPNLGVSEQFLNDGDQIIFHYTDDHTKEGDITPTVPDKSSLLQVIQQAESLKEADYTPESWTILQSVLGEARKTAANEGAPSAEIEAMQNSLTAAIESLQKVQLPGFRQALKDTLAYIAQTVPAPAFGTTSGEWSVLALARGGYDPGAGYFDEYYDRIVETVKASPNAPKLHAQKSTDNSRLILALSAIGRDPRKVGGVNLLAAFTDMDWVEYQGVNGPIFALIALDSGNYPDPGTNTRQALVDRIVSRQLSSGGFPINPGGKVDLDMTGMALQALAPYKAQANVSQAIDRALAYLSSVQNQNGGFGNNSEVNVQAIVALSALGIDAKKDSRFVKPGGDPVTALLNYAADGGGFEHIMSQTSANAMATDQAAYALVAYTRFLDGKNRLYDMTDVELVASGTVDVPVEPVVDGETATARPDLNTALGAATTEDKGTIQVTVAEKQKDKVAVILNSITAGNIADAKKTLDVVTENGGLSIVHEALKSIAEQAAQIATADEIVLNVERKKNEDETVKQTVTAALDQLTSSLTESKDQIAAKASIIEVTIKVKDQKITTFDGHSLTVDLPVSSDLYAAEKNYKTLVISDGGKIEEITGRCRDRNGKRVVTVRTTHLSTFVVVPVLAAAEPVKPKPPTGNGEIEVRFTLLGDSIHGETDNPHTLRGGNLDTWVSQTTYTLKEGATVWDLLKKVFSDNGMTCSNPSGNYVESITWKGKTLGEFTNGKNSGWMYTLNGTHPSLGVSEQELHDGDRVVWHYTDDYTKEEGSEKWGGSVAKPELEAGVMQPKVTADKNGVALAKMDADSVKEMIANAKENNWNVLAIQPDVEGTATRIGIALTKETVGMITDKSALDLDLRTKYGNIVVTNAGLKALAGTVKETLELSVEKTERGTVMAEIAVDGRRVDNVTGGVLVSLPLEGDGNVVAIIRDGKEEIIRKSVVDGKRMLLLADGSCELKIVDNRKSFNDTPNHWAKDAVDFVSSHELFNGTGANVFAPDTPMSRAMLATVLFRLENAAADGSNPFNDVAAGTWYTDAVIWASGNKIVNGTGNGFAPDRDVTRQELVAMLYRYANSVGMDTGDTGSLDKFTDRNGVADWAQEAMGWAVANGLVNGRTATTLAPEGMATRGEVAAITQRLVTLMVK